MKSLGKQLRLIARKFYRSGEMLPVGGIGAELLIAFASKNLSISALNFDCVPRGRVSELRASEGQDRSS
jgi:hypothetical protein